MKFNPFDKLRVNAEQSRSIIKKLNKLYYLGAIGFGLLALFFVITCSWIGYEVKNQCVDAQREYSKTSCVEALTLLLNDESQGFRTRNSAVWALGQLGDSRALPILESYYTGIVPERESLDKTISQYELKKAINLARGGFNLGAIVWRHGILNGKTDY